jgi:DNA-binding MarR family transcriptional regulator
MLRSLERLGWIERRVDPFDRRTRIVTLSYKARSIVWNVLVAIVRPRVVADELDAALKIQIDADVAAERKSAEWLCRRLVWKLGRRHDSLFLSLTE